MDLPQLKGLFTFDASEETISLSTETGDGVRLQPDDWMLYLASFGGILLTFLAGTEIDTKLMKERFKESFLIDTLSFLMPFVFVSLYAYYIAGWSYPASLIAGSDRCDAWPAHCG